MSIGGQCSIIRISGVIFRWFAGLREVIVVVEVVDETVGSLMCWRGVEGCRTVCVRRVV